MKLTDTAREEDERLNALDQAALRKLKGGSR